MNAECPMLNDECRMPDFCTDPTSLILHHSFHRAVRRQRRIAARRAVLLRRIIEAVKAERQAMIEFRKRAKRETTLSAERSIWETWCGSYRVVFSRSRFGPRKGRQAIADEYRAEVRRKINGRWCWAVISRHKRRERALEACRKINAEG